MKPMGGARPGAGRPKKEIDEKRIINLANQGRTQEQIAIAFNVSAKLIHLIIRRRFVELLEPIQARYRKRSRSP